jgi:hypothetical protein
VQSRETLEYEITPIGVMIHVKKPDIRQVLLKYANRFVTESAESDLVAEQRERRGWGEYDLQLLGKHQNDPNHEDSSPSK